MDSKISRSKFEPRQKSSELHLSLQAFRFAHGGEVRWPRSIKVASSFLDVGLYFENLFANTGNCYTLLLVSQQVFIHCKLVAWDPAGLDNTKKACHYDKEHG